MDLADILHLQRRAKESPQFLRLEAAVEALMRREYPHLDSHRKRAWHPVGWQTLDNPYALRAFEESFLDNDPTKNRHLTVRIVPDSGAIIVFQPIRIYDESKNTWRKPDPQPQDESKPE